jgi:hypothetical protein
MKLSHTSRPVLPFASLLMAALLLVLAGCEGPQGPPGRDGFDGRNGRDGLDAPLPLSIRYTVLAEDWLANGTDGQPGYFLEVELPVPEITQSIVDDGMVLVYYQAQAGDPWLFLPYTFISSDAPPFTEVLDFIYGFEFVNMKSQANDFGATPYEGTFRVVVAPAEPVNKAPIDYTDYDSVAEFFDLDPAKEIVRDL